MKNFSNVETGDLFARLAYDVYFLGSMNLRMDFLSTPFAFRDFKRKFCTFHLFVSFYSTIKHKCSKK